MGLESRYTMLISERSRYVNIRMTLSLDLVSHVCIGSEGRAALHQRLSRLRSFQTMGQVPSGNAPGRGLNKDKDNKVCQKAELLTLPEERGV